MIPVKILVDEVLNAHASYEGARDEKERARLYNRWHETYRRAAKFSNTVAELGTLKDVTKCPSVKLAGYLERRLAHMGKIEAKQKKALAQHQPR